MFKKAYLQDNLKDRTLVILFLVLGGLILTIIVNTAIRLQISDVQIPVRYSGFGQTNIYRGQWYSLTEFIGFGVLLATINTFIILKIYPIWRSVALSFLGFSIFLMTMALIVVNAIFNMSPTI